MLLVEDRDEDVQILQLACRRAKIGLPLRVARNGAEAIEYLKGEGRFANRQQYPFPTLMLLDISMPGVNGFEVLEWLRLQPGLRRLVVIIFTSSNLPEDINRAFELGANSYVVKPPELEELEKMVRYLEGYWLKLNQCPDCSSGKKVNTMRLLLRSPETGHYFRGGGEWTDDPKLALNFAGSELAMQSALGMKLSQFELVVELGSGRISGT